MTELQKDLIRNTVPNVSVRLNKYLSDAGLCSRREADRLIEEGRVLIDGMPAVMGQKVNPGQTVTVNGEVIRPVKKMILLAFNKPAGVECTSAPDVPENIVEYINYPERIYPIGRLDKNSTGLILLTNTGELVNRILKSANQHEKEYIVQVDRPLEDSFISAMQNGVILKDVPIRRVKSGDSYQTVTRDVKTAPCSVSRTGTDEFSIILTQGINRQIRRMCEALGYNVTSLHRVRIMNIELGDIPEGKYREVTEDEASELVSQLSG